MARFTRRKRKEPEKRRTVTHMVPVRARCIGCGMVGEDIRFHYPVTVPEGEPAPEFVDPNNPYTSTLCENCRAKREVEQRARYGDEAYERAHEAAEAEERKRQEEQQRERRELGDSLRQPDSPEE